MSNVVIIGLRKCHDDWQLETALLQLADMGQDKIFDMITAEEYDIYDMSSYPEKGDAYDAITKDTPAVIAFHLFGIDETTRNQISLEYDYFYNNDNHRIYLKCKEFRIPLFVWGDQPVGPGNGVLKGYFI